MKDTIVFDIETQKSFEEVGGRENLRFLGLSVLAAYSYNRGKTFVFEEENLREFNSLLTDAGLLVGFNSANFDIPILEFYGIDFKPFQTLDLMDDVRLGAGFRVSLNNIARATLGEKKSADGLQAIKWYKEGNMENIKKYCVHDVAITRNVYEYGKKNSHVFFINREKEKIAVPVFWAGGEKKNIREILEEAFADRKSVEIKYITHISAKNTESANNTRVIDIYEFRGVSAVHAFCHLRKEMRVFKIERIVSAKPLERAYKIESDIQSSFL